MFSRSLLAATNAWRKVDLNVDMVANMADSNMALMQLVFVEMGSQDEETMQVAKKCIVGLLKLSMKKRAYERFNMFLTQQIFLLRNNI